MTSRRTFIKFSLGAVSLASSGPLLPRAFAASAVHRHAPGMATARMLDPLSLTKFADPLPILPVLEPTGLRDGIPFYEVGMTQFQQKLHAGLPPTTLWGYDGRYIPGTATSSTMRTTR